MPKEFKHRLEGVAKATLDYLKTPGGPFLVALLLLAGSATWFAATSAVNYRQAGDWAGESRAWKERSLEAERLLRRSEADVADLERRQLDLAEEKSDSEDQSNLAELATDKAVIAGAYQARCAEALLELMRREDGEPQWARQNRPGILAYCRTARDLWNEDGEPDRAPERKGSGR